MADQGESGAALLGMKDYARAVPLLKQELENYPSNPRIRLQYAEALAGNGSLNEAIKQYEETAKYYDDNGLTVQAIAVRKQAEKVGEFVAANTKPEPAVVAGVPDPLFSRPVPNSPRVEVLTPAQRAGPARRQ